MAFLWGIIFSLFQNVILEKRKFYFSTYQFLFVTNVTSGLFEMEEQRYVG
jgi:hypothetical protein